MKSKQIFKIAFLAFLVQVTVNVTAQKSLVKAVYNSNYPKIIQLNNNQTVAVKKDYNNQRALAFAYCQSELLDKAFASYNVLFSSYSSQVDDLDKLYYSLSARKLGKYKLSDSLMLLLKSGAYASKPIFPELNQELADALNTDSEYWSENDFDSFYVMKKFPSESTGSEFALVPDKKGNVFFSKQYQKGLQLSLSAWNHKPYYAIFKAKYADSSYVNPVSLTNNKKKLHQYVSYYDINTGWIYITRNAEKLNAKKERVLKVLAVRQNPITKEWKEIEFKFNNSEYSVSNLVISPDRKKVIFVSDNPSGFGKSDLWEAPIISENENGLQLGEMSNMGPEINTILRDNFPTYSDSGVLYFSSEGHFGFGGLDVFFYDSAVGCVNLGKPVNSRFDDFAAQIHDRDRWGTLTSNRETDGTDDNNYFFRWSPELEKAFGDDAPYIVAVVKDALTGKPLANVDVAFDNINDPELAVKLKTDSEGRAKFEYIPTSDSDHQDIQLSAHPCGYRYVIQKEIVPTEITNDTAFVLLAAPFKVGDELGKLFDIKPIYYQKGQYSITTESKFELDKLVVILQDNPGINVELGSHTDARADAAFNLKLSENRAKAAYDYVIKRGVPSNRIAYKGYGESKLVNNCKDGVNCSDLQHEANRRTEFIIRKMVPCDGSSQEIIASENNNTESETNNGTKGNASNNASSNNQNNAANNGTTTGTGSVASNNGSNETKSDLNKGALICGDFDGDNIPDYLDSDSDNDGLPDATEGKLDFDGDGMPNFVDKDSDNDGIADAVERAGDVDKDGRPNYLDADSDNDGIDDKSEGTLDSDKDGTPNYQDSDSDGDGINDRAEGVDDFDKDGISNYLDLDSDGDGINDAVEGRMDVDHDGKSNFLDLDSDGDTIPDAQEKGNGATPQDFDKDGKPDFIDTDSDEDGLPDKVEAPACLTNNVSVMPETNSHSTSVNSQNSAPTYTGKVDCRVQFIISKQKMDVKTFESKGVGKVFEYYQNGYFKYTSAAVFASEEAAAAEKARLRSLGYADAFVVVFQGGVRVK